MRVAEITRRRDRFTLVMNKYDVKIIDLHALVKPKLDELALGPDNVHFKTKGKQMLGKQVAEVIKAVVAQQ